MFIINTLGLGGAEGALLELMKELHLCTDCSMDLYVMLAQGELIGRVPPYVRVLNRRVDPSDVLSDAGRRRLFFRVLRKLISRFSGLRNLHYMIGNGLQMARSGSLIPKNLLWKAVSDGSRPPEREYDLAVAFIEGASTYYAADRVQAKRKAAFVHIDYRRAGYTRMLDHDCYSRFQAIFCVSPDTRSVFLSEYPELTDRTFVFSNIIDPRRIRERSEVPGGFADGFDGIRIVSLGRLVKQKSFETAIEAASILIERGHRVRWYVFGEGEERGSLEREIRKLGLTEHFILAGAVLNPYPYLRQAQIYVQCSRYEGRSIAVREAKVLGLPVVLSATSGDQVTDGLDGIIVDPDPRSVADGVERMILDPELRRRLGKAAAESKQEHEDIRRFLQLLEK